ncbi:3-deoxy-D-manno-octulosonic-acid transferase [Plasticicumulans lactativorans]|uniref:3-deoxy-D-manno-octulosonic acid transferase n=1 Tax=Plasticicumulans lactativorans TaxID=1133106 RepID=A0A4R2L1R0_9GAMM|nr:lipid IV(A) 3-deoxy-D-manno-octulosonic acid transferase [Plasticicumulans lactativorans]TCO79552.1 3-deoxy-D-manno-octulosonic-acid transferase [Plasticicumulans lactativorans]
MALKRPAGRPRRAYSLLLTLLTPFALARLWWRGRANPAYRARIGERFGCIDALPAAGCLWLHAVSLGEVRAAVPLVRALQARHPDVPVLITTTTPTGSAQVRDTFAERVHHVYMPYDLPGAVARFLARTRPRIALIMETELWPNLFAACAARGVPVLVANARLSARSARGYARVPRLTAATLADTTLIAAQADADAERFRTLGAPRVEVLGNLKYDLSLPEGVSAAGAALRAALGAGQRPVLIAASTHAGEDEAVLDAAAMLRGRFAELLLILVPRHPERFDGVAELVRRRGLRVLRRSRDAPAAGAEVYLGDTLGELLLLYAAADLAWVGGSFAAVGGHNVLEPAALGLPVLFGPHMFNFAEAERLLLDADAAQRVADAAGLAARAADWLADPAAARAAGARGRAAVAANRGALERLLARIETVLAGAAAPLSPPQ